MEEHLDCLSAIHAYAVPFAAPGSFEVGDDVALIGFSLEVRGEPSLSKGGISRLNRKFDQGMFADLIQTDGALNPGNSGGPMFNMKGEVIGVNTYKTPDAPGLNFARSCRTAAPFVQKLIQQGAVYRRNVGLRGFELTQREVTLHRLTPGLLIMEIEEGSPVDKAGLQIGDIVIELDGEKISCTGDFFNILAFAGRFDTIEMKIVRLPQKERKLLIEEANSSSPSLASPPLTCGVRHEIVLKVRWPSVETIRR